jgi:bacterial/archaeal transporter family-2 protein
MSRADQAAEETTVAAAPGPVASAPLPAADAGPRPRWLVTLPLMLGSGALVAVQSQVNGTLAGQLGTGLRAGALAALISFGSGLVLLTLLAMLHRPTRRGVAGLRTALVRRRIPRWMVLGGLGGAFFVASQGLAAPTLGVTFFILCVVAGQAVMALVVDHHGWGPSGVTALSRARLAGAALAVVAVGVSGAGVLTAVPVTALLLLLAALPLVAGGISSVQQGINGRLTAHVGSWVTTWNNFCVGTLGLTVFLGVALLRPGHLVGLPATPWLYLGGICGIGFIWASTVTVPLHGVLVVGVFNVAGQVVAAAVIEAVVGGRSGLTTVLAVVISLAGAGVVGLASRRRRAR